VICVTDRNFGLEQSLCLALRFFIRFFEAAPQRAAPFYFRRL
jgi:hypothetical protein